MDEIVIKLTKTYLLWKTWVLSLKYFPLRPFTNLNSISPFNSVRVMIARTAALRGSM